MNNEPNQTERQTVKKNEQVDGLPTRDRLPVVRSGIAGVLMGMANLVPGVSGGTMILVMGLYDEFIADLADLTRLRFSRRSLAFLAIVACGAGLAIVFMAGLMGRFVADYEPIMFSIFIGMTLGGVPALFQRFRAFDASAIIGVVVGLTLIITIALTNPHPGGAGEALVTGETVLEPSYVRDVVAGAVGICAMVLPGISGAYMLLILGRYRMILAAISEGKHYAVGLGGEPGSLAFLHILIPVSVGAILSLILASNFLKWMLRRHPQPTLGLLLGILLGSVVGLWPFREAAAWGQYLGAAGAVCAGFFFTYFLSRIST